jgi:hypothetical protein
VTRVAVLFALAAALLLGACGTDHPSITDAAAAQMTADVAAARRAAASGQYSTAAALLDRTSATVGDLERRGEVSTARAREVTSAIDTTRHALDVYAASSTTTSTSTTTPEHKQPGEKRGKHGKGEGGDDGEGDDE